jgi:hypothetical protein
MRYEECDMGNKVRSANSGYQGSLNEWIGETIEHILYQCMIIGSDTVNLISTYNKQVPKRNLNHTLIYELEYYNILELLYSCHVKK